jgi:hypothetical protein
MDREKIIETVKIITPGKIIEIGYYDLNLIHDINSILRDRGFRGTYYGDTCTLCIFGSN